MLGIGVIGAGRVAQVAHLPSFAAAEGARLVALADLRPGLGAEVAARFAVPALYNSHHDLLADRNVDAVVVVTQRSQTAAIVADALRAGKHVLSEKPMAQSVAEGRSLVDLAADGDRRYAIGYMKRHDPGVAAAHALLREWIAEGRYGALLTLRATMDAAEDPVAAEIMTAEPRTDLGFAPTVPATVSPAASAGYERFLNVFSHTTNLVRHLLGLPLDLVASQVNGVGSAAILARAGETPVVFSLYDRQVGGWNERIDVLFEAATLRLELPPNFSRGMAARVTAEASGRAWELPASGWAFTRQARSFVEDVDLGREPLASGRDALDDLRFAEEVWRPQAGLGGCRY